MAADHDDGVRPKNNFIALFPGCFRLFAREPKRVVARSFRSAADFRNGAGPHAEVEAGQAQ